MLELSINKKPIEDFMSEVERIESYISCTMSSTSYQSRIIGVDVLVDGAIRSAFLGGKDIVIWATHLALWAANNENGMYEIARMTYNSSGRFFEDQLGVAGARALFQQYLDELF